MKAKLAAIDAAKGLETGGTGSLLSFIPDLNSPWMPLITFLVYISVNWWAVVVSGRRARRRRFRRPAHVLRPRREALAPRHPVVQHRPLCHPALAVDPRRPRLGHPLPGSRRSRDRLRPGHDRPPAAVAPRPNGRRFRRRLHVHHRHPAQLGRQLSGQRFLPPVSAQRAPLNATTFAYPRQPRSRWPSSPPS